MPTAIRIWIAAKSLPAAIQIQIAVYLESRPTITPRFDPAKYLIVVPQTQSLILLSLRCRISDEYSVYVILSLIKQPHIALNNCPNFLFHSHRKFRKAFHIFYFRPFYFTRVTMPQLPRYTYTGPVDHTVVPDKSKMKGKSVVVTGGANGIGEACVRAFVAAGAFVTFGDLSERGKEIEKELNADGDRVAFVKCDIRSWDEQKTLFETAVSKSPSHSVDVVLANAGISRSSGDSLWNLDGMRSYNTVSKCCLSESIC